MIPYCVVTCTIIIIFFIEDVAVSDFTPNFVLVVTWINLADDVGNCRWYSYYHKLNQYWWWYQNSYYQYMANVCRERAKTLQVSSLFMSHVQ